MEVEDSRKMEDVVIIHIYHVNVTPPKRVILTTWGPPPPRKQALIKYSSLRDFKIRPVSISYPESSGYSATSSPGLFP